VKLIFSSLLGIIGVIVVVVSLPFMALGSWLFYITNVGLQGWALTSGTVSGIYEAPPSSAYQDGNAVNYCPSVAYTASNGEAFDLDLGECSTSNTYAVGDKVDVYYNTDNPQDAVISGGPKQLLGYTFAAITGLPGGALCLGGVGAMVLAIFTALRKSKAATPAPAA
jgi:hypothetical protein